MQQFNKIIYIIFAIVVLSSCGRPIANFSYSGEGAAAPTDVEFKNESEKAEQYEWDFGDGEKSSDPSPTHEYKSSGNYNVVLKAKKGSKESKVEKRVFIDAPKDCMVLIETDFGSMTVRLYNETPKHRDNFIKLAEEGYYDGLLFHRVINGFMIQGGDPKSRKAKPNAQLGSGGPGYQVDAEFNPELSHIKGALAAARTGGPGNPKKKSSGSQFYIVSGRPVSADQLENNEAKLGIRYTAAQKKAYSELGGTPQLDMEYTVFGMVVDGLDVIDKIAQTKTNGSDRPLENVTMKITVIK